MINAVKTLPRDYRLVKSHVTSLIQLKKIEKNRGSVGKVLDALAKKNPEKVCFYFQDEAWTYKKVEQASNKIGNFFAKEGFKKDDSVAIFMENRPEYICMWLGLSKIGVVPALINFNLRSIPLKHSFEIAKSKALICGYELSSAVQEVYPGGQLKIPIYGTGQRDQNILSSAIDLDKTIETVSESTPPQSEEISFLDNLFYMYTSGTTGFPKAAIIKHSRFFMAGIAGRNANQIREEDIIYTTLPLYHTASGILGASQALICGSSVALRHKFSAKNFWKDCIRYNATVAQYMGETCRYLLRQPPSPEEQQHKVRLMFGNGLRAEIWEEFVKRFNIKDISEVYGSSEGNASFINFANHPGACGIIPPLLKVFLPIAIVKLDSNGEPIRDPKSGLLIQCKPNEPGELVSKIVKNHPFKDYKGYADDPVATKKKIVRGVFEKDDFAFRSGDVFTKDELGFFYFKDRMGDTYKWKGENVSTAEVEYVISALAELKDCVVFGVNIPGSDGQAGMAAIADPDASLDVNALGEAIHKSLAPYARPIFLRLVKEIEMTGTHKMKKTDLSEKGYDITSIKEDKMYYLSEGKYIPLGKDLYNKIISGEMRL